jgi:hypothetical protein
MEAPRKTIHPASGKTNNGTFTENALVSSIYNIKRITVSTDFFTSGEVVSTPPSVITTDANPPEIGKPCIGVPFTLIACAGSRYGNCLLSGYRTEIYFLSTVNYREQFVWDSSSYF